MRRRAFGWLGLLLLGAAAGGLTLAGGRAQTPSSPAPKAPAPATPASVRPAAKPAAPMDRLRDLSKLPELTKQMLLSSQRGMEWLSRFNQPNGLFLPGYLPALNKPMEGDHFLRQATAAFALARAARFSGDERYAVRAQQAILVLLAETKSDPAVPGVRMTAQPSVICNRLGGSAMLALAIHELPDPAPDLLDRAEELCQFIRHQQQANGSLHYTDGTPDSDARTDPDGVNLYPGPALYALAQSQRRKPAAWKTEALRKALPYYRAWFKAHPSMGFVPWMTAAYAEGFVQSREAGFADFVCEMNDWLCTLQYEQIDPRHPLWRGGFQGFADGKPVPGAPQVETALYAQSLADACRAVRYMPQPDVQRYARYRSALTHALQFLTTLQYSEENTIHFAPNFRLGLLGGFHPSHLDGNLRVDQTALAVSALVQFLAGEAERR